MTDPERIKLLFALIAFATLLSVQAGMVRNHFKKIPVKNHGRPTYSLFTYGLDLFRALFRGTIPSYLRNVLDFILPSSENCPTLPQVEVKNFSLGTG
jgi:hypothetical protein